MNPFEAARIIALRNVISDKPDNDYEVRKIQRWYSKAFSTPLHQVEEIPFYDIFVAYWEEHYESLEDAERIEAAARICGDLDSPETADIKSLEQDNFLKEVEAENAKNASEAREILEKQAAEVSRAIEETFLSIQELEELCERDSIGSDLIGID